MVEEKTTLKSLAAELEKKIAEDKGYSEVEETKKPKKEIEDVSDEEIEEASRKISEKEIKEESKHIKENVDGKKETLIPLEDYIKCAVHLGTKVITPNMRKYVYKRRADGLAVINTALIDEKIRESIKFLNKYDANKIYLVCKREAGWDAVNLFSEITGIRVFTKKYPPGITTNLELDDFFEAELTIICDPWIDKNALNDTLKIKKPVLSLCDTNNYVKNMTQIIPCNNKSKKSIGCILYLLARGYAKEKGLEFNASLEDFTDELE